MKKLSEYWMFIFGAVLIVVFLLYCHDAQKKCDAKGGELVRGMSGMVCISSVYQID